MPGTWKQILPTAVTSGPSSGTIPTDYLILSVTRGTIKRYAGGYSWETIIGANGGALTWAKILEMEQVIATSSADISTQAFVTNAKVRSAAKQILRNTTGTDAAFVWTDANTMNGYPAHVSTNIASNLTTGTSTTVCSALCFGCFDQVLIGFWGGLDIMIDPYSAGATRVIRVYGSQYCDVAQRNPASFARCLEITT